MTDLNTNMEVIPEEIEENPDQLKQPGKKKPSQKKPKKEKTEKENKKKAKIAKESQIANQLDSEDNSRGDIEKIKKKPAKKQKKATQSQSESQDNLNQLGKNQLQKKQGKKDDKGGQKLNDDQIEGKIVNYFKKLSNRPFSAKNIVDNMKKILSEGKMKKFFEDYCARDDALISQKKFGSAPLFWYKQSLIEQIDKEELQAMQDQYEELRQIGSELNEEYLQLHNQEQKLSNQLTNEQLANEIEKSEQILKQCNDELEFLEGENYHPVEQAVMKENKMKCKKMEQDFKLKKELVTMFLDMMQDAMEGKGIKHFHKSMNDVCKKCKVDINDPDIPFMKV